MIQAGRPLIAPPSAHRGCAAVLAAARAPRKAFGHVVRNLRILAVFVALWFGILVTAAPAATIYVNAFATGSNDGTSWANAYTILQSALSAAVSSDQIWVAAATYKPTSGTDRTVAFVLKNGVAVYGGFNGTETMLSQRNPAANVTILSGDIGMVGVPGDNSYHVVTADGTVTASGVLDGFRITAGNADGANPDDRGGGMRVFGGGSPAAAQCIFTGNSAGNRGGAIRVDGGSVTLTDCVFEGNSAVSAGGAVSAGFVTSLGLLRCRLRGNSVPNTTGGGGIEATDNVTATNCLISGNSPNGVSFTGPNNSFFDCTITGQSGYGAVFFAGNNVIANSVLWGNGTGQIFLGFSAAVAVSYSDIQGGWPGAGNIAGNPLFVNPGAGDFRLSGGSPAVDAGNNAAVPPGVTTDLAGLPRFFDDPAAPDTGAGTPPLVDMGAHERIPLSVTAPNNLSVCAGASASFSVTANGSGPLSYRWRRNGSNLSDGGSISGSATAALTINPTVTGDSGNYDVVVADVYGQSVTSAAAGLTVNPIPGTPAVTVPNSVVVGATGVVASVPNNPGSSYNWTLTGGTITSGQGTAQITFNAGPAGTTMTLSVVETNAGGCSSQAGIRRVQVDFLDVPPSHIFRDFVNAIARNGITSGCGGGNYCPDASVSRDQMAVFLLRGKHGGSYVPPPATGMVFNDVPATAFAAAFIEQLFAEGITSGCSVSPPLYCPGSTVSRAQMAVFLLRARLGSGYAPPPAAGIFGDVPVSDPFAPWIEDLFNRGITSGCSVSPPLYCPNDPNTRGQMAVFLTRTFNLQ